MRPTRAGFGLSELAYQFIGGVIDHASAASAVVAPTVNSYKRIGVGAPTSGATWSPAYAAWGGNNRTQMIRVPGGPRFEHRSVDGSANPYLAAVAILGSGLDGIERKLDPGERQHREPLHRPARGGRRSAASSRFRRTCSRPAGTCRSDEVLRDWFGHTGTEHYSDYIVQTKVDEFNAYHGEVSEWERRRYLTLF